MIQYHAINVSGNIINDNEILTNNLSRNQSVSSGPHAHGQSNISLQQLLLQWKAEKWRNWIISFLFIGRLDIESWILVLHGADGWIRNPLFHLSSYNCSGCNHCNEIVLLYYWLIWMPLINLASYNRGKLVWKWHNWKKLMRATGISLQHWAHTWNSHSQQGQGQQRCTIGARHLAKNQDNWTKDWVF